MRTLLISTFLFYSIQAFNQTSYEINKIDSLTGIINHQTLRIRSDSSNIPNSENPLVKVLNSKWYEDSNSLKKIKWENVFYDPKGNSKEIKFNVTTMFYYDSNKLIKVENIYIEINKSTIVNNYYYKEDVLIYTNDNTPKSQTQAKYYLDYGNQFSAKFLNKESFQEF
jgi:hypothetical protein